MKFLVDPFSLHFFLTKKISTQKNIFRCFSVCFWFTFFLSSVFKLFFFHPFYLSSPFPFIFLFISCCFSLLYLFSPFRHSSFTSLSPCFSFSFFSISSFLIFFLHRRFNVSSFCFNSFLFSLFCSWSHLFWLPSSLLFFHLRICLCPQKNSVIIFRDEIQSSFFFPSLLRCLISCFSFLFASSCFPCLFHVFLIFRVSWCYFSWYSFNNLLYGSLKKKWSFCFWKVPKNIFGSTPCFSFSCCQLFPNIFSCVIQKEHFSMFPISLLKNILFLNLFVSIQKKKSPPKKTWFSWFFLLTFSS